MISISWYRPKALIVDLGLCIREDSLILTISSIGLFLSQKAQRPIYTHGNVNPCS